MLAVAFEKQSEGNAQFALGSGKGASLGAGGAFAPFIRAYIHRSGAPEHIGWKVAVKDRQNALKNPYAHLKLKDISIEKVKASPMMWDPIRFLESCPSSDGACAVVLTDEAGGKAAAADGRRPAWVLGHVVALGAAELSGARSGPARCVSAVCRRRLQAGGDHEPAQAARHGGALRALLLARGDVARGPSHRRARRGLEDDRPRRHRDRRRVPDQLFGGVLSSNPIGASGLLRFAEAANQVRGVCGEMQVDGAKTALGMAYGANSQYFSMWVVGSSLHPFG